MDNFNTIIKQKAEQFEVPFNDAHWTEMEAKLIGISSSKKKTLFLGSAFAVITVALSSFFLFTPNTAANISTIDQSVSTPTLDQPTLSEKETTNNTMITEEKTSEVIPKQVVVKKEKTIKEISSIVVAKKREALIPVLKTKDKPVIKENVLQLKTTEAAPIEELIIENSPEKATSTISPKVSESNAPTNISTDRIKNVRYKVYKDENLSKKSVKLRLKSFFSFFSFKKKLYKVPLSKSKSLKREK